MVTAMATRATATAVTRAMAMATRALVMATAHHHHPMAMLRRHQLLPHRRHRKLLQLQHHALRLRQLRLRRLAYSLRKHRHTRLDLVIIRAATAGTKVAVLAAATFPVACRSAVAATLIRRPQALAIPDTAMARLRLTAMPHSQLRSRLLRLPRLRPKRSNDYSRSPTVLKIVSVLPVAGGRFSCPTGDGSIFPSPVRDAFH